MDPRRGEGQLKLAAALALFVVAGCVTASPEVIASAERGRAAALADLAGGTPRFAYIGLDFGKEPAADAETGLPRFSIGCCKSREAMAYRDAYNETVAEGRRR